MKKTNRLVYILNLIRTHRSLNADRIAEMCKVTPRTVYRDISSLSEAGVPIYYDKGYKLASNAFLPPLNLSPEEFQAVRMALETSILSERTPYEEAAKSALVKILNVLNGGIPEELRRKPTRSVLMPSRTDFSLTSEELDIFRAVEGATRENRQIYIRYTDLDDQTTFRLVDPYVIVFRRHAYYLVGFCSLRRDFRTFRISRIASVDVLDSEFIRDGKFTVEGYFRGSLEVFRGEPVQVRAHFTGRAATIIRSGIHHHDEVKRELEDGTILYEVETAGINEIELWLRQFGADVVVEEPEELRSRLKEFHASAFENAEN